MKRIVCSPLYKSEERKIDHFDSLSYNLALKTNNNPYLNS